MLGDVLLSDQYYANLRDGMIASRLQMEELLKSSDFAQSEQMSLEFISDENSIEDIKKSFDPSKLSARSDQLVGEIFWRNGCDILWRSIEFFSTPVGSRIAKYLTEASEFVGNTQSGFELAVWRLSLSGDDEEYRKKANLVKRIVDANDGYFRIANMAAEAIEEYDRGFDEARGVLRSESADKDENNTKKAERDSLIEMFHESTYARHFWAARPLNEKDLKAYLDFLESEDGAVFFSSMVEIEKIILSEASYQHGLQSGSSFRSEQP